MVYTLCLLGFIVGTGMWVGGVQNIPMQGAVFFWGSGVIFLGYGLIRDLILIRSRQPEVCETPQRMTAICFESTVGGLLVLFGLALEILAWTRMVTIPLGAVVASASLIVAIGHYTRDWVFILAKVKNHRNLIPSWKISTLDQNNTQ